VLVTQSQKRPHRLALSRLSKVAVMVKLGASVPQPVDGMRLVIPIPKGGVSLATRPAPKGWSHSLPLTLSIEMPT
jgi:hypothetical protein